MKLHPDAMAEIMGIVLEAIEIIVLQDGTRDASQRVRDLDLTPTADGLLQLTKNL